MKFRFDASIRVSLPRASVRGSPRSAASSRGLRAARSRGSPRSHPCGRHHPDRRVELAAVDALVEVEEGQACARVVEDGDDGQRIALRRGTDRRPARGQVALIVELPDLTVASDELSSDAASSPGCSARSGRSSCRSRSKSLPPDPTRPRLTAFFRKGRASRLAPRTVSFSPSPA